jgi:hypothetical protein
MLELRRLGDPSVHLYTVREARFDLDRARLDVGVELEHVDDPEDDAPCEISIRLASLEWADVPSILAADGPHGFGEAGSTRPRAFVYSGFHHTAVRVRLEVVGLDDDELTADMRVETDDVVRYDDAATRTVITGPLTLRRGARDAFWHP